MKIVWKKACVLSSLPIVCKCLVVAYLRVIPKMQARSAIIVDVNADALSVMRVVGKYECWSLCQLSPLLSLWLLAQLAGRRIDILKK